MIVHNANAAPDHSSVVRVVAVVVHIGQKGRYKLFFMFWLQDIPDIRYECLKKCLYVSCLELMPHPSAWTKNVLSGTKKFCLGQKKFCPGQKYSARDKMFWSPVKSSFLFMRIQFRSCSKFFV